MISIMNSKRYHGTWYFCTNVYLYTMTIKALMLSTHVPSQITRYTKTLLAHITLVRFLVRVNTHVGFQTTRLSKTLLAHITFVRFLFRVRTHVCSQM